MVYTKIAKAAKTNLQTGVWSSSLASRPWCKTGSASSVPSVSSCKNHPLPGLGLAISASVCSVFSVVKPLLFLAAILLGTIPALSAAEARGGRGVPVPATPELTVETGEIAGAKFTALVPRTWNRRILLIAHGLRDADMPLIADLEPDHPAYRTLVNEGWIVAKSSYRRNGVIIADAIADLDALRTHLVARHGEPGRVLVAGDSMGGLIAVLLAEREPDEAQGGRQYDGVVAVGPALGLRESNQATGLSRKPGVPIVFLANQSELGAAQAYTATAIPATADRQPHFLRVSRDGHVNVNAAERLAALRALNLWLDTGRNALPAPPRGEPAVDITVAAARLPTQVTMHADGRGFDARVLRVSANYGNLYVNVQPDDFIAAGIRSLHWFQFKVGERTYRTRYGSSFDSVERGEWVAFGSADGFTWVARNLGNAATATGLKVGDTVTFRANDGPP
jgi:dienelactone hydrolase